MLVDFLLALAGPLIAKVGKDAAKRLLDITPVTVAIDRTASAFDDRDVDASAHLRMWCESSMFLAQLREVMGGGRALTDGDVVNAFIEVTGMYADDPRPLAHDLLAAFFQALDEELHKSELGPVIHAREERREHDLTRQAVAESTHRIEAKQDDMLGIVEELARAGRSFPRPADDVAEIPEVRELVLHTKIDHARDLINAGKTKTARVLLEELRVDAVGQGASDKLLFRIVSNLAACALNEGDVATANEKFSEALQLQPESPKAISNAAIGAALSGDHGRATDLSNEALERDPRDVDAMTVRLLVLQRAARLADLDALVDENAWIRQSPQCLGMLGQLRLEQGRWEEAESLLRDALRLGSDNPHVHQALATTIYVSVQRAINEDPPLHNDGIPKDTLFRLEEAERQISIAVDHFSVYEDRSDYYDALASRAGLRSLVGRDEDALRDCETVLVEDPDHPIALHNKALLLLRMEGEDEAIDILERLRGAAADTRTAIYLSIAHFSKEDFDDAISTLEPIWNASNPSKEQLDIADVLVRSHACAGHDEAVEELSGIIRERWPGDPEALWVLGRARREQGRFDEAVDLMREALANADGNLWKRLALELAETLFATARYAEAVELFERTVDPTSNTPAARRYLVSLCNAGLYSDALRMARALRGGGPPIPKISEVEAAVLEYTGDLERALEIHMELSRIEPDVVWHRIRAVVACIRRGDTTRARSILEDVSFDDIKDDADALVEVARARMNLDVEDVLPLAYRARKLDFRNPDTHITYLTVFLNREKSEEPLLEVDQVDIGCAVHLKHNGETEVILIVDDDLPLERNEVRPDDDRATRLLGRRKGDSVTWKKGAYEELTYKIADVQSVYVFAFQETLNKFSTWFPEHGAIERIEIRENDFTSILLAVDRRHELAVRAEQLYASESVTLGMLAEVLDVSVIDVWGGLVSSRDRRIIAASGATDDIERQRQLVASQDAIVLNISSILTLAHMELLQRVRDRYEQVLVAQETLDIINEHLATKYSGAKASTVMGKEEGRYVYEDITQEALEKGKRFLERTRDFLPDRCDVVPATEALAVGKERFEELSGLVGREAVSSILVAKERGVPLVADDLRLRLLASTEWQVAGAWTQDLLWDMKTHKLLSEDQYQEAVIKLLVSNLFFVSVTAEDVMQQIRADEMKPTPRNAFVLERVLGPDCSEESALRVGADVMRAVWLEPSLYEHKLMILDLILNSLTSRRPLERVLARFDAALQTRFALMVPALQAIRENIRIWTTQRRFRQGLI